MTVPPLPPSEPLRPPIPPRIAGPLPSGATTAEILAACRQGHPGAADALFRQYFSKLVELARRRLSRRLARRIDAEDVVLSAYRSFFIRLRDDSGFPETETADDLWALLVTITRRKIAKQSRRHWAGRRSVAREISDGAPLEPVASAAPAEAAAVLEEEVEQLVASLRPTDREVLIRSLQGLTSAEIAAELNCAERTVRRARQRIDDAISSRRAAESLPGPPVRRISDPDLNPTHRQTDLLLQQMAGEGSFSKVYRALDRTNGGTVAVKFLKKDQWSAPRAVAALIREHEILRRLDHPGIVGVRGWGITPAGAPFLILQWIDGTTLAEWNGDNHLLRETLGIARQIAEALAAAHSLGITHGDLSPANVLRTRNGRVLLTDFGFAQQRDRLHHPSPAGGTPGFLAPELLADPYHPAAPSADVYGFGAILHFLLTGQSPAGRGHATPSSAELRVAFANAHDELGAAIAQQLAELLSGCLAPQPNERPIDLLAALRTFDSA